MTRTVVFIHGGWVTALCWDLFVTYVGAAGYRCLAPAWPGKDRSVAEIRRDPSPLAGLGIEAIVDHCEAVIRTIPAAAARADGGNGS